MIEVIDSAVDVTTDNYLYVAIESTAGVAVDSDADAAVENTVGVVIGSANAKVEVALGDAAGAVTEIGTARIEAIDSAVDVTTDKNIDVAIESICRRRY